MTTADVDLTVTPLSAADWPEVAAIYAEGLATGQASFETAVPSWADWDASHLAVGRLGARHGGRLVGWAALAPVSRRAVYAGVAEVSVYVAAAVRGQGVGRALLAALVRSSEEAGLWTLQAAIFPENAASVALHRGAGFREVGRRERIALRGGHWRDTLLFERRSRVVGADPYPGGT